jgi:hypothetical protein
VRAIVDDRGLKAALFQHAEGRSRVRESSQAVGTEAQPPRASEFSKLSCVYLETQAAQNETQEFGATVLPERLSSALRCATVGFGIAWPCFDKTIKIVDAKPNEDRSQSLRLKQGNTLMVGLPEL